MSVPLFPAQASSIARQVDWIYLALLGLSGLFLLLVAGPIAYFLFKYRRGKKANRKRASLQSSGIEIAWTVIPTLLLMGVFGWSASVYFQMQRVPPGALEINVVGKQWMWKVQHPQGRREINELHVPAGRAVKLVLASEDVIHSFFLPAFRIKQDAVPGRYTTEWFRATETGSYRLLCAEYCGDSHSRMIGRVVVMRPAEYQEWLGQGAPADPLVKAGEKLFRELGCSGCHVGNSTVRAPPLEGLFGRPVPLRNGQMILGDEKYIRDSILLPQLQIRAGYEPLMPTFQGHITEEEILELVAYLKSLGSKKPEETP